jgi:hypothetical protein
MSCEIFNAYEGEKSLRKSKYEITRGLGETPVAGLVTDACRVILRWDYRWEILVEVPPAEAVRWKLLVEARSGSSRRKLLLGASNRGA